jgi:lipid II:glycine glycyltransferase (peptidoglycan interpeptide bridge formation enzyme)
MGSSLSMDLDLRPEPDALLGNLSGKWRRNLRLAQKEDLVIKQIDNPDIEKVRAVFAEMEGNKQLPELFSREKLESLFRHAGPKFIFLQCEDRDGNILALRGTLIIGNRACDYLAATSSEGRRLRASYPLLWDMLRRCRERGITEYDLGGIDPWGNPGVYDFKRQTGAREVEFLGEWDWATSPFLRWLGNRAIGTRQNFRTPKPSLRARIGVLWPPAAMKWVSDSVIYCPAIG